MTLGSALSDDVVIVHSSMHRQTERSREPEIAADHLIRTCSMYVHAGRFFFMIAGHLFLLSMWVAQEVGRKFVFFQGRAHRNNRSSAARKLHFPFRNCAVIALY